MNLYSAAERLAAFDRSAVAFDPDRCLHAHDRFAECDACVRTCPVGAIESGKPPLLESEKCTHCLACLPACPLGAFSAKDSIPSLLNCITRSDSRVVELVCGRNPHVDRTGSQVSLGLQWHDCLAGLGAGGYMALAALGLEEVILRLDACQDCPWQPLRSTVEAQVALARQLLVPFQKENMFRCVDQVNEPRQQPLLDVDNPPLTRRDLFRLAARQGQVAVARAMELNASRDSSQPGLDRMRVLGAIQYLPEPSSTADPQLVAGDFALVSVSEACSACGACARACPTAALQFSLDEVSQTFQLDFSPSLCIGCELCIHVCEPGAVSVQHDPPFSTVLGSREAVRLFGGAFARCERCKAIYPARQGAKLCSLCEYRSQNPFGSRLPPGFRSTRGQGGKGASL
jgi:ferredoxin